MFEQLPLWINAAVFAGAAVVVWIAGTRIAGYADAIARKTGIGHATVGLLLLAGITSLPEVAVTVTASATGNAQLAVNNLLGSVAMQVAILAVADAVIGRDALTSVIPDPVVLLQIALNTLVLAVVAAAVISGDHGVFGVGVWSIVLFAVYVASIWLITKSSKLQGRHSWVAEPEIAPVRQGKDAAREDGKRSLRALALRTAAGAAVILVAGFLLSKTGEAIAAQTGLGQNLGGFLLLAISTSLPEVSTVIASVRRGRYVMAVSDIFGTNLFNGGLVLVVDAFYRGGPVLNEVGNFAALAALLGIVVSVLFLVGLIERRDRTFLRMGYDSVAVLVAYVGGVALLFTLD
ncbi:MAG: sodium:calcium antiporter [Methylibium sp.]|uniref:sodium:calcium antiporter n=1 Tax=Methylibium sp. TaxID=2067992 RepID=UPI0017B87A7D|nr:sodium:calcium antiporter [Methylibium sp.]MBA3596348.1 sodium:calcium antiporter [Methylibium sp.]